MNIIIGILLPFLGTTLGALLVFFMKEKINEKVEKLLLGFASGVMLAASIWSLLIPAIDMLDSSCLKWMMPAIFFILGMLFLLVIDNVILKLNKCKLNKTKKLLLVVTLHNIPEGLAVGIVFAGVLSQNISIGLSAALALSFGIAIQNFPEGAIISMPLKSSGMSKLKSFFYGVLSGIVEPISAIITILITNSIITILPLLLSFAAGAMIFVVVDELIPEAKNGKFTNLATVGLSIGFAIMMILDIALG